MLFVLATGRHCGDCLGLVIRRQVSVQTHLRLFELERAVAIRLLHDRDVFLGVQVEVVRLLAVLQAVVLLEGCNLFVRTAVVFRNHDFLLVLADSNLARVSEAGLNLGGDGFLLAKFALVLDVLLLKLLLRLQVVRFLVELARGLAKAAHF